MQRVSIPEIALGVAVALSAVRVDAQAWTPPRGEGAVSISYQNFDATGHFEPDGQRIPVGASHAQTVRLDLDYALTDRLALIAGVPFVSVRNGNDGSPVLGRTGIDDGQYHSTWQDLRVGLRYAIVEEPIAASLLVEQIVQIRDYPTIGEAAPGRGLDETLVGVNLGHSLNSSTYIHLRYAHAFVEEVLGVSTNRDNIDLEAGYAFNSRYSIRAIAGWQDTHGGINFPIEIATFDNGRFIPLPGKELLFLQHDRLLDEEYFKAGLGARATITGALDLFGFYVWTLEGSNTHSGSGFGLGVTWLFGARQ